MTVSRIKMNGRRKWRAKNRTRVALLTANPPQTHLTRFAPIYGIADRKLVITVAAQNLIWPQGRTYPINAVAIVRINSRTPTIQVSISR